MKTSQTRRKSELFARFRLDERVFQRADPRSGRPGMVGGEDRETGERVVIKQWRREPGVLDDDLRDIWREEIRQLHRLAGYPGAGDYIVTLVDAGEDDDYFYLVLRTGQRLPLQLLLNDSNQQHWIRFPRQERNRLRLWQELRRLSAGLDILHAQGLLHRNLDPWAVFCTGGEEADFQLSGFEWSVRLVGIPDRRPARPAKTLGDEPVVYSFLQDWQSFGALAAGLLGLDAKALLLNSRREAGKEIGAYLSAAERDLLLLLLRADPLERLDGEVVSERIDRILGTISAVVGRRENKLYLTCGLGNASRLSNAIREASGREIEIDDIDAQLAFIASDLREEALLLVLRESSNKRFLLAGRTLTYRLRAYQPKGTTETTWSLAFSDDASPQRPPQPAIAAQRLLENASLEIVPLPDVRRRMAAIQGKSLRWDEIAVADSDGPETPALRQYKALLLVQLIEALFDVSEVWAVRLVGTSQVDDRFTIRLQGRDDEERRELSDALGLRSPMARMYEAFANDQTSIDEDWCLTDVGVLGDRGREITYWKFVEVEEREGAEPVYVLEGHGPLPTSERLFLRLGNFIGNDRLLRRRIKALRSLREHAELLETLADPRANIRQTHETLDEDAAFLKLDTSKQEALREIWAVSPMFLVQGPPGVGKTHLVRELVRRRLHDDNTTRLLLTAQSHHAVDHLLDEVQKALPQDLLDETLVVRCRPKDHDAAPGSFDLHEQARAVIASAMASSLVATAPPHIKLRLDALAALFAQSEDDDETTSVATRPDRSLEALLLRCANLVFASTNAGDLERLIEERSQFDWSIVEEAGKATGVELVSPLLLSHRRLLIGDHKQLPPYGADQFLRLLEKPHQIKRALEVGRPLVSRPFREGGMDDDPSDETDGQDGIVNACSDAAQAFMMLETMVEAELGNPRRPAARRAIAKRLSYQHRMHPAIAELVSHAFYKDDLRTDENCEARFKDEFPPFEVLDTTKLPVSPIVFIDMPFVQRAVGRREIERRPRYHNPDEVHTAVDVLSLLRPKVASEPSLAVLSPYREQVRRLHDRIAQESESRLRYIKGFSFESGMDTPVGTVDSFQGSEADVVVLSLVRNNGRAGLGGLGFLADERRMNVLLSRAKWKLVLIGSLEFLRTRVRPGTAAAQELEFLTRFLKKLDELTTRSDHRGIPLASVVRSRTLRP